MNLRIIFGTPGKSRASIDAQDRVRKLSVITDALEMRSQSSSLRMQMYLLKNTARARAMLPHHTRFLRIDPDECPDQTCLEIGSTSYRFDIDSINRTVMGTPVPEPGPFGFFALGMLALGVVSKQRAKAS
jgi:hypothetical protein